MAVLAVFGSAALVLFAIFAGSARRTAMANAWLVASNELGLDFTPGTWATEPSLNGTVDGFYVSVKIRMKGSGKSRVAYTQFEITGKDLTDELTLSSESTWSKLGKVFTGEDLQIGDPLFDQQVQVRGSEDAAFALLTDRTRGRVSYFVAQGGVLERGAMVLEIRGRIQDGDQLVAKVRECLEVATALSVRSGTLAQRVAQNVPEEPVPAVQLRMLKLLEREHDPGLAIRAAKQLVEDSNPEVRLEAAMILGGSLEVKTLQALLRPPNPAEIRARALQRLLGFHQVPEMSELLGEALESGEPVLQERAASAVHTRKDREHLRRLAALLSSDHMGVRTAAARALGGLGSSEAESALLTQLEVPESTLVVEICQALAKVGTLRAVEPLLPLSKAMTNRGGMKDAARDAIRAIQARHSGGASGGLSIANVSATDGSLSLVEKVSEPGNSSEAEDPGPLDERTRGRG